MLATYICIHRTSFACLVSKVCRSSKHPPPLFTTDDTTDTMPRHKVTTRHAPAKKRAAALKKPRCTKRRIPKKAASTTHRHGRRRSTRDAAANVDTEEQSNDQRDKPRPKQNLGGLQLEGRPPLHHRVDALIEAAYPGKRRSPSAYDDRIIKRRRTSAMIRLPWEAESERKLTRHGQEMEKPRYVLHDLFGSNGFKHQPTSGDRVAMAQSRSADEDPIGAMGLFAKLPTEIRDMAFRNLLLHHKEIRVLCGWSLLFPRSRPNLETGLLRVCRVFYRQGVRILYGENSFVYLNRDPAAWRPDTEIVVKHVYDRDHVPIDKYGHMIRRIKIVVEANRMRQHDARANLPTALQKFLPSRGGLGLPAQLHTVTIELPVQTRGMLNMKRRDTGTRRSDIPVCSWFRRDSSVLSALMGLNCQFIRILAYNYQNEYFEALIDRRSHFTQLSADEGNFDTWSLDDTMLTNRQDEAKRSRARLSTLYYWLEQLAGGLRERDRRRGLRPDPQRAVLEGPFRHYVPRPDFGDPLEALPSDSSGESSRRSSQGRVNYGVDPLEDLLSETDSENDDASTDSSDDGYDSDEGNDADESMFVTDRRGGHRDKFVGSRIRTRA